MPVRPHGRRHDMSSTSTLIYTAVVECLTYIVFKLALPKM